MCNKIYTFFIDTNLVFCVIFHIISIVCDDDAFFALDMTLEKILTLSVRKGLNCQFVSWKEELQNVSMFCGSKQITQEFRISFDETFTYGKYHDWVKRLEEETGFVQVMTIYCLWRAIGNVINDDFNSNEAVRNLVMDHINSIIFHRNYLSRMIRYHTQATYRGTKPCTELIQAANRMSRLIDPRRLKRLTQKQKASLRQQTNIQTLCHRRDQLYHRIRTSEFKFLYRAKEQPIHDEYQEAKRVVERLIKTRKRALKKQIQAEYNVIASMKNIQAQFEKNAKSINQTVFIFESIRYVFEKRVRVAQIFFDSPSKVNVEGDVNWRISIMDDLVSLCSLQEGRFRKTSRQRRGRIIECDFNAECT